jgi:hypothetical protein
MWFDVDVLGFQIELYCRYFGTWRLSGLLFVNWAIFSNLSLVNLVQTLPLTLLQGKW